MLQTNISNLALCKRPFFSSGSLYVLYDHTIIQDIINARDFRSHIKRPVFGKIEVEDNNIHGPVAAEGYGPTMYMIAMQESPEGIESDGQPSPSAVRVWDKFYEISNDPNSGITKERDIRRENVFVSANYVFKTDRQLVDTAQAYANHQTAKGNTDISNCHGTDGPYIIRTSLNYEDLLWSLADIMFSRSYSGPRRVASLSNFLKE